MFTNVVHAFRVEAKISQLLICNNYNKGDNQKRCYERHFVKANKPTATQILLNRNSFGHISKNITKTKNDTAFDDQCS